MSDAQPKLMELDPSSQSPAPQRRKVFAAGQVVSQDSDYSCIVTNDTNNPYIVYLLHDNNWIAELWGQPPGTSVAIPPTWKLRIMPVNNGDVVTGTTGGSQTYWACWSTTTQANSTFYFSKMSY